MLFQEKKSAKKYSCQKINFKQLKLVKKIVSERFYNKNVQENSCQKANIFKKIKQFLPKTICQTNSILE